MIKEKIISKALELGFDLFGFSEYQLLVKESEKLKEWLSNNYQAGMGYMEKNVDKRKDVCYILDNCKSIISLGMNYNVEGDFELKDNSGKVSRYAWGRDYHFVIWEKLDELIDFIKKIEPSFEAKSYVDTGPVMDKAWAVKSGLGWQGKHSNVINKEIGSWFFIANLFTNYKFDTYNFPQQDFCGSCTACIDACPTDAIVDDYVVDANKCISYLTIENKNDISEEFVGKFNDWIFGCDICQEVCPWNIKFAEETTIEDFHILNNRILEFSDFDNLSNREFKEAFKESPILRSKLKGLRKNAEFLQRKKTET